MSPERILVVGGGFYGCLVAEHVALRGHPVTLLESEPGLLARASYRNQARLHRGYHYPRSYTTAKRSCQNFGRFREEFVSAVRSDFTALYAIARRGSKVTPRQFERFCDHIRAPYGKVESTLLKRLHPRTVHAAYRVEEFALDVAELGASMARRLAAAGVEVRTSTPVAGAEVSPADVELRTAAGERIRGGMAFNCTYSGLTRVAPPTAAGYRLKHEIAELALVEVPAELAGLALTVLDGPFFSLMPFPARGLATLSHVRYTPHLSWVEAGDGSDPDPDAVLRGREWTSSIPYMLRDAARYAPALRSVRYVESLFEVKTVLWANEVDDGRPILFHQPPDAPRLVSVLGSKLDNAYDVLTYVDRGLEAAGVQEG